MNKSVVFKITTSFVFLMILSFITITAPKTIASTSIASTSGSSEESSGYTSPIVDIFQNSGRPDIQIPLSHLPGRAGLEPNIVLRYRGDNANGWIGVGWDISMGAIQRSTKHGIDYDEFSFEIDGQELVPVNIDSTGNGEYRLKIEGSFARFDFNHATGWVVTRKEGKRYYYGQNTESRQDDPENSSHVFKWCLDRVEDTNHNFLTVTYVKPYYVNDRQIYLDQINYTGNSGGLDPTNIIKFVLDPVYLFPFLSSTRTDTPPDCRSGVCVKTTQRLQTIEVIGNGLLSKKYIFNYDYSAGTNRTLLSSITPVGSDDTRKLPDIVIDWQQGGSLDFTLTSNPNSIDHDNWASDSGSYYGDWNGDGVTDMMWYSRSKGNNVWYITPIPEKFLTNPYSKGHYTDRAMVVVTEIRRIHLNIIAKNTTLYVLDTQEGGLVM